MDLSTQTVYTKWPLAGTVMLVWATMHAWVLRGWFHLPLALSVWDSAISNVLLLISGLLSETLLRSIPSSGKLWYTAGLNVILAFLCLGVTHHALIPLADGNTAYLEFFDEGAPVRWVIYFLVISNVSSDIVLFHRLHEQEAMHKREATTASIAREAELQKLQLQLQPHFLFNCLNSVNALIQTRPEEARKMVQHLSDFLRLTIRRADEHWISLAEEWNYLQLYLEIEKVRFGHRLKVNTAFHEGSFEWKLPTLLLQPLVENAVKFGLYGTTGNVTISIKAELSGGFLYVYVSNPFDQDMQPPKGSGFGLAGLKRRLYLLFARNDLLETTVEGELFTVMLKIPEGGIKVGMAGGVK